MLMRTASRRGERAATHNWPALKQGLSELQAEAAMRGFLYATGWDAADFELHVDPAPLLAETSRPQDRIVTVRRLSTGDERLYYDGPFSAWYAQLLQDVEQGHFGMKHRARDMRS